MAEKNPVVWFIIGCSTMGVMLVLVMNFPWWTILESVIVGALLGLAMKLGTKN